MSFNNINYTAGSVSIGTTDDNSNLQVEGNVYVSSNLEIGTANLYVDTETSSVGIGTKAPQATLHVEGNVYASSNIGIGTSTPQYSLDVHGAANVGVLATTSVSGDGYLLSNISSSEGIKSSCIIISFSYSVISFSRSSIDKNAKIG